MTQDETEPVERDPEAPDYVPAAIHDLAARRGRCDQQTSAGRNEARHLSVAITHLEDGLLRIGAADRARDHGSRVIQP